MNADTHTLSRRQLLKWIGGAAGTGAVALGSVLAASSAAGAAAVPTSRRFDLSDSSTEFLREIGLQETRVLQSFAFDNTNKHLYTAQVVQGGRQLSGETQAYDGATRAAHGDPAAPRWPPSARSRTSPE